jgi:hypothetical protein
MAGLDVEKRHAEENHGEHQHQGILHAITPSFLLRRAGRVLKIERPAALGFSGRLSQLRAKGSAQSVAQPESWVKRLNQA